MDNSVNIEEQLKHLWEKEEHLGKIKACLFTLILYTSTEERTLFFDKILKAIIQKYPCRVIFIKNLPDRANDFLEITVNSLSSQDNASIVCDQIYLSCSLKQMERIPYLVIPHLVADLPIFLFWGDDPTVENSLLELLKRYVNRIIFDSDPIEDLHEFSHRMLHLWEKCPVEMHDLNWVRLSGWRTALRQTFDDQNSVLQLQNAETIVITYAQKEEFVMHPLNQALFLKAWLISRLGKETSKAVSLNLKTNGKPEKYDAILSIEIKGSQELYYLIKKIEDPSSIKIYISSAETCELPFTIAVHPFLESQYFLDEIFYHPVGTHYKEMLKELI